MDTETVESGPATDNAGEIEANTDHEVSAEQPEIKSLDDALDAAFQSAGRGNDSEAADPASATRGDEATDIESPDDDAGKPSRERDEKGRFKAGDKRTSENAPSTEDSSDDTGSEAQTIRAKDHWSADQKAAFDALPTPEAKQAMLKLAGDLEAGFTRKSQEASEQIKTAQAIDGLFSDEEKQSIQRVGHTPVSLLGQLMEYQRMYMRDPAGYARYIVQSAGLDPSQVFAHPNLQADPQKVAQPGDADSDEWVDPDIQQLKQTQTELQKRTEQQFQALPDIVQQQIRQGIAEAREQEELGQIEEQISAARIMKDDSGNPRYPYFDRLEVSMADHLARHKQHYDAKYGKDVLAKIDAAYMRALAGDPEFGDEYVRTEAQRFAEEQAKASAEQQAQAQRQTSVDRAKRAAAPVRPASTAPDASRPTKGDLDSILADAIRQHSA